MKQIHPGALPRRFREALFALGLPTPDAHILVAYSGGADSTALLHLLSTHVRAQKQPPRISAIHVHHGIRGAEADRDASHCRQFCESLDIALTVVYRDVPALAQKTGQTLEEAARNARYDAFTAHLQEHPDITHVLTAHHADDQAETVLFRMLRGTALRGITGIPAKRVLWVPADSGQTREVPLLRPLLNLPSASLVSYLDLHGITYVTDSTNTEEDASRNLLRCTLIPAASRINPMFSESLLRLSKQAEEDETFFSDAIAAFFAQNGITCENGLPPNTAIPTDALKALHPALIRRILACLYDAASPKKPLTAAYTDAMLHALARRSHADLPGGLRFYADGAVCRIRRQTRIDDAPYTIPLVPGIPTKTPTGNICFFCDGSSASAEKLKDLKNIYKFFISTHINSGKLLGELSVRSRSSSDLDRYFCGNKTTTVRDALSAHRVPHEMRRTLPLFCDGSGIVWIPFCGIRDDVNPRFSASANLRDIELYYFYQERG
ncbi:MAG: tRNA lysidine(34) synthetase TilS [Clostridia bacterium]|nr:tRNA lysidine(34) synthetase TilS [Clostridia bacterium]